MSSLMRSATSIERDLSNQDFEVRRLLLDFEDNHKPSEVPSKATVELPKISAPTFDGDILNWSRSGNNSKRLYTTMKICRMPRNLYIYEKW